MPERKKKYKKKPKTPRDKVRNAIMRIWFYSRERKECLRIHGKDCVECGEPYKEIHHIKRIDWDRILTVIYEEILNLNTIPLCKECHDKKRSK